MVQKNSESTRVAVIGGGSWATALVKILSENDVKINWWVKNPEDVKHIKTYHCNRRYLSNIQINLKKVKPSSDLLKVLEDVSVVLIAVPAAFVKEVFDTVPATALQDKIVVSAVKGMIIQTNELVTDYISKRFHVKKDNLCFIAGPCHSEEVAMEKKSYLTIAGNNIDIAGKVANLLQCRYVKVSTVNDLYGAEYCAIIKNIIAIACGIARGLNYGDNFQAVLVANAMQEVERFLNAIDPKERNLNGSAYLGDLLVTAYSQFSRNRTLGNMIGRGYSVKSALVEMAMIAEGYYAAKCIYENNKKYNASIPVIKAVYNILYEKISPSIEIRILEDTMG